MFVGERKKTENINIVASENVEGGEESQGAMEMDPNVNKINKKDLDTESQNYGAGDVSEEDIDLDDLEEVTVTNGQTEGVPVNVEIQDYQAAGLGPSQLIQVNLPLSQIITSSLPSSTPPVLSELSDQANQEYQEICSFFQ